MSNQTVLCVRGPEWGTCGEVLLCSWVFERTQFLCINKRTTHSTGMTLFICSFLILKQTGTPRALGAFWSLHIHTYTNKMTVFLLRNYIIRRTDFWTCSNHLKHCFHFFVDHSLNVNMSVFSLAAFRLFELGFIRCVRLRPFPWRNGYNGNAVLASFWCRKWIPLLVVFLLFRDYSGIFPPYSSISTMGGKLHVQQCVWQINLNKSSVWKININKLRLAVEM